MALKPNECPKCHHPKFVKAGVVQDRQRYKCKSCGYYFTVSKQGKEIDPYYVIKALQLYIEGVSYREIERLLGISHVTVMNYVKKYHIKAPENYGYRPSYQILSHAELLRFLENPKVLKNSGLMISELGDKYMTIKWEKFRD
jgi:transposase-like protein